MKNTQKGHEASLPERLPEREAEEGWGAGGEARLDEER